MNKTDLTREIYNQLQADSGDRDPGVFPLSAVKDFMDLVLMEIASGLKRDGKVVLSGFGTLYVREQKARMGINPRTGESLRIPARRVPAFKPGKALKEKVR